MPLDLRVVVAQLATIYESAGRAAPAPAHFFVYDAEGEGRQFVAAPGQSAQDYLRRLNLSRRSRKVLAHCHFVATARTVHLTSPQTPSLTAVHLLTRDGVVVELLRVPGDPSRDEIRSTRGGDQVRDEVLDDLAGVLRASGTYAAPAPPAAAPAAPAAPEPSMEPAVSPRPSDLARLVQELADRYDRIDGGGRSPMLYTLDGALQAAATVSGRSVDEHPVELLDWALSDDRGRAAIAAAQVLGLAHEAWTYPPHLLEEVRQALVTDPDLDIMAAFGRPSERPDRVELSAIVVGTRDGVLASLERRRIPDAIGGGYLSTEVGDRVTGRIPNAIAAAFARTAARTRTEVATTSGTAPDVLQQVLTPALSASYLDGFTQVEGYVVRAADVLAARSPAEAIEAFGYGSVADVFSPDGGHVDVLRFVAAPLSRLEITFGSDDPAREGAEGSIVDRPPFRGNGFTASERMIIPQWRLERTRVAPGSELYRLHRDGTEELLAVYRDVATGWAGPPSAADALPSHLVGTRARWQGNVYLADLLADGTVALAFLGETPPAGFERTGTRLWRRVVARADVETVDAVVTRCRWRGQPFEITGQSDDRCRLAYTGRNAWTAEALQLLYLQPGVYEATAPRGELTDITSVALELPAGRPEITVPPAWASFAAGLHSVLRDLQPDTFVIISWTTANVFVQYHQEEDKLSAEAIADEYAPDDLTIKQVGEMTDLGWTPPTIDPAGRVNWYIDLAQPAGTADLRRLAAASVQALRIRGVPSPDELAYRAWHDREPGNPATSLPGLGIPRQAE